MVDTFLVTIIGHWRGTVHIHINSHVEGTFMCGPCEWYIHMWQVLTCVGYIQLWRRHYLCGHFWSLFFWAVGEEQCEYV